MIDWDGVLRVFTPVFVVLIAIGLWSVYYYLNFAEGDSKWLKTRV